LATPISIFADDEFEESLPLVIEEFQQRLFLTIGDATVGQRVETQLLEVGDVEIPGEENVEIVECDTFVAHESWVVRIDRYWQALVKEATSRVISHVEYVTENEIAYRTAFNANFILLDHAHQSWMICQMETVTNSFGTKQNGIIQLLVLSRVALSCVKVQIEGNIQFFCFLLGCVYLRHEITNRQAKVFFLNHVEPDDHVGVLLCLEVFVDL